MNDPMQATDILRAEHDVILRALACLDTLADRAQRSQALEADRVRELLDFFEVFADRSHHRKEEAFLFATLCRRGLSPDEGPVAVMLAEHDSGRAELAAIRSTVEGEGISAWRVQRFIIYARHFASVLREHLRKENEILFPLADRRIPQADQEELIRKFESCDVESLGAGEHERYVEIAHGLCDTLGVKWPTGTGICQHVGHG